MKPIYAQAGGALALTFAVAACIPAPDSTPAPEPVQRPAQTPAPPPIVLQPTYENWMDAPRTPGTWYYRDTAGGSIAVYGEAATEGRFNLRCDRSAGAVSLARAGATAAQPTMIIRTETRDRTLAASATGGMVEARLAARDPLLDAMALTKGRFAVEVPGQPPLYLPAWAEVTRVIEDCR